MHFCTILRHFLGFYGQNGHINGGNFYPIRAFGRNSFGHLDAFWSGIWTHFGWAFGRISFGHLDAFRSGIWT